MCQVLLLRTVSGLQRALCTIVSLCPYGWKGAATTGFATYSGILEVTISFIRVCYCLVCSLVKQTFDLRIDVR